MFPWRSLHAAVGDFSQDATGVTLETPTGRTRVEIWGDRIARVLHAPTNAIPAISSLAVNAAPGAVAWQLQSNGSYLLMVAPGFSVRVEVPSGRVRFFDADQGTVLAESDSGTTLTATSVGSPAVASYVVTQKFDLAAGEAIYGLGQHQQGIMNYVGQSVTLLQKNTEVGVPVLLSNKGYAVLWDNPAVTTVDAGKTTAGKLSWSSEAGDAVNYYFCFGPEPDKAIAGYRALTGAAPMFGKWAWGYWQSKERYASQSELLSVASTYRSRGIPIDGIIQDWRYWADLNHDTAQDGWGSHTFDPSRYPDPAGLMSTLHAQNFHTLISVWAKFEVTNSGVSIANLKQFENAGAAYSQVIPFVYPAGQGKWYDPFNATGRQIFWNQISQKIFACGWDGWWLDASEPELSGSWGEFRNYTTAQGPGARVFNAYPLMHTKTVYDGQRAETSQKRAITLTRSGYAGLQRHAAIVWSGDIGATWEIFAAQIPAGLNFVASGIPYWNTDIGGFFSGNPATDAYAELYTRWFQYGAFCPMFRSHGTNYAKEVWRFPTATQPILIDFINLRYRLMPYIYSTAWRVTNEGYTMMRPLVMDFRADPNVNAIGNQFLFGPSLLVNPVTTAGATSRSVYLPAGTGWYDFWTGLKLAGGQTLQASAPIEKMPLYVRAGSIIPCGPLIQYATQSVDPIELRVYTGADGSFTLYEDEGDNYNYESGARATIPFSWDEASRKLTIGPRAGSFPGMQANRTFKVVFVSPLHGVGVSADVTPDAVVNYDGSSAVVAAPPAPPLPEAPASLQGSSGANGISLSWMGPSEGVVYHVRRSSKSGGPYTTLANSVIGTSFLDKSVEPGTSYFYVLSAINATGEGPASSELAVTHGGSQLRTLLMFNEAAGSVAADGSGKGWHATLVNAPTRVVGKGGNAVDLNGTSQYASLPAGVVSGLNNLTISAWVHLDANAQGSRVFDFGSGPEASMFLTPRGDAGVVRFSITAGGIEAHVDGAAPLPAGAWTHVAISVSGGTGILYINGAEAGRTQAAGLDPLALGQTTQNWIGRSQSASDPYLDGRVDDFRIFSGALSAAEIQTLATGTAGALLSPWTGQDIGSPTIAGSSGCGTGGASTLHVTASGSDIQGASDQFRFVWQSRSGDSDFLARVDAMDASDPWAKAGLMVRASLNANAVNCLVAVTPQNGVTFQYRTAAGGSSTFAQATGVAAPCWLKISRSGNIFSAYRSADGVSWTQVGNSVTLSAMPATASYGVALTSHTNTAAVGASVSQVAMQDPPPPIPVTASAAAPVTDADDRFFIVAGLKDSDNLGGGGITTSADNDEDTYVASDRSSKGQSFTTGAHFYGYRLRAFTLQHVQWPQFLTNGTFYNLQPNHTFKFQVGVLFGDTKMPIYSGMGKYSGAAISGSGTSGTGTFLTFDLSGVDLPVLSANTTCYFEVVPAVGNPYLELNGSRTGDYGGGSAFRGNTGTDAGNIGPAVNLLTGDRVFVADLVRVAAPDYPTWISGYPGVGSHTAMDEEPDGDGMTNWQEYVAGTDPSMRTSVLHISEIRSAGGDTQVRFQTIGGKTYRVEASDTLKEGSWTVVQGGIAGTGSEISVTEAGAASHPRRFYRLIVE